MRMTTQEMDRFEAEEQEKFEAWCKRENWPIAKMGYGYKYPMQQMAFKAWLARAYGTRTM